jgi:hypothetical protein
VSPLYLYAILDASPATSLGAGLAGETLRTIPCGPLVAAVGAMSAAPAVSRETMRGHDAVVRRLMQSVDAVLPARFGMLAADAGALCEQLEQVSGDLGEALARVAGREQMILRVFTDHAEDAPPAEGDDAIGAGPGTRYLTGRARVLRAMTDVGELAPLRPVLDRFVVAERVERHQTAPLVASVYHLVRRGDGARYAGAVEDAARTLAGVRVTVSGPWAAYAFAPDTLR